jgi:hypothetical protein
MVMRSASPGDAVASGQVANAPGHGGALCDGENSTAAADAAAEVILASLQPEVRAAVVRAVARMLSANSTAAVPSGPEKIKAHGRLRYVPGFEDVWLGSDHYDLRERKKARLCIQYLVENGAFDAGSARHLKDEIDPHVRRQGDFPPAADIKIDHYFKDQKGRLPKLRKDLIVAAGRNGRYFLRTD